MLRQASILTKIERQTTQDGTCGDNGMGYTMPTGIIGNAETNGATIEVRIDSGVDTVQESFEFQVTVYKSNKEVPPSERPPPKVIPPLHNRTIPSSVLPGKRPTVRAIVNSSLSCQVTLQAIQSS